MSDEECAASSCTNTTPGSVREVLVRSQCRVSYVFDTRATVANLPLAYAVAVNGEVLPKYAARPASLGASDGRVEVRARPGDSVALFLNSDARVLYRQSPMYQLKVGEHDVEVFIVEKMGRDPQVPRRLSDPEFGHAGRAGGRDRDIYRTVLNGDTWMAISHKYTGEEAARLLPSGLHPLVVRAVLAIFNGLSAPRLTLAFPAGDGAPALTVEVDFLPHSDDNARDNISQFNLLRDGLARVHPLAYAALFSGARAAGVTRIGVTSGWRPLLGSIVHRAGLGLDTGYIDNPLHHVGINRAALITKNAAGGENVSAREKDLYRSYIEADKEGERMQKEYQAALNTAKVGGDAALAESKNLKLKAAQEHKTKLLDAWNAERNRNEPELIKSFRGVLHHNATVSQVLDPWYIDLNTRDASNVKPNAYRSGLEITHRNHLHITIAEPTP